MEESQQIFLNKLPTETQLELLDESQQEFLEESPEKFLEAFQEESQQEFLKEPMKKLWKNFEEISRENPEGNTEGSSRNIEGSPVEIPRGIPAKLPEKS